MRPSRRLLSLLSLLLLLWQPVALLHGLSHLSGDAGQGSEGLAAGVLHGHGPTGDGHGTEADDAAATHATCWVCWALGALALAALPVLPLLGRLPPGRLRAGLALLPRPGGTAAGYHARGPPRLS